MRYVVAFFLSFIGVFVCQLLSEAGWYGTGSLAAYFGGLFMCLWLDATKTYKIEVIE